jgi:hypothetical protein
MSIELTGRDLDAAVAERVMEFRWFHCVAGTGVERNQFCSKEQLETWLGVGWKMTPIPTPPPAMEFNDSTGCPNYSTDIAAAYEMEAVVIELELGYRYADELDALIARTSRLGMARRWDLIHATAEQRCRAALAAVDSKRPEPPKRLPTIREMSGLVDDFTNGEPLKEYMEQLSDE